MLIALHVFLIATDLFSESVSSGLIPSPYSKRLKIGTGNNMNPVMYRETRARLPHLENFQSIREKKEEMNE